MTAPDDKSHPTAMSALVPDKVSERIALGGLLVRKERWALSVLGKLLVAIGFVVSVYICAIELYPFLSAGKRVSTNVLVVDGWLPTYQLEAAAGEFARGRYTTALAVRGVYDFDSVDLDQSWDDYVADILIRHGIPRENLHSVLFSGVKKDRTFYSALAIAEWFRRRGEKLTSLNVITQDAHVRRSRLLYEMALGKGVSVGVIGLDDQAYDTRHWWRSSEGIREVLFEGVAYLYVRLIFSQPPPKPVHLLITSH